MEIFFWILVCIFFYAYLGYGILLSLLMNTRKKPKKVLIQDDQLPRVVHIIAAYNEEDIMEKKIRNSLSLEYPVDKMQVMIITDGSTDRTADIVRRFPAVIHLHDPERKGKAAAINRAVSESGNAEILVFSDANTLINADALIILTKHYTDPKVGGVSGEKVVLTDPVEMIQSQGEGLYWKYESWLKKLDADFYSVAGAAGELLSIRKDLFETMAENIILDDLYLSLNICKKGYVIPYEPGAMASELPSSSIADERKRRVRISAGAFQAMAMMPELLNIFKYGKLSFLYISHRVLRWAICPFALPLVLALNILIVLQGGGMLYKVLMSAQFIFYALSATGALLSRKKTGLGKLFFIPYYFIFMNISVWEGLIRYLNGTQSAIWEKASRKKPG